MSDRDFSTEEALLRETERECEKASQARTLSLLGAVGGVFLVFVYFINPAAFQGQAGFYEGIGVALVIGSGGYWLYIREQLKVLERRADAVRESLERRRNYINPEFWDK